jgi:3',5'-cyclic AMP phosphodiesterase CpdA
MFKLAHLSDPHLGPLPAARPVELLNKRISGFLSWHLNRRRIHDMLALKILLEDIRSQRPDHIAVTGDLINISLPGEYENALRWLSELGRPDSVTFVPGNHDAYIDDAWEQGVGMWSKYYAGDMRLLGVRGGGMSSQFPFVRLRRYAAIIGVSSARPTGIGMASGWLGREQIEALQKALSETRRRGFYRILMIHHPPVPGLCPKRKSLLDCGELLTVLESEGAELVLFGHDHRQHYIKRSSRYGQIHMFGVPSASLWQKKGTMAGWNLYAVRRQENSWLTDVTVRTLDIATRSMVTGSHLQLEHRRMGEVQYDE